jgi:hypothetical protein
MTVFVLTPLLLLLLLLLVLCVGSSPPKRRDGGPRNSSRIAATASGKGARSAGRAPLSNGLCVEIVYIVSHCDHV